MKRILVNFSYPYDIFDPSARDGAADPMIYLREYLRRLGYELEMPTADSNPADYAFILFGDYYSVEPYAGMRGKARMIRDFLRGRVRRRLYSECLRQGLLDRLAIFLWEPPSVIPQNFSPRLLSMFPKIFTWNDSLVDGAKFFKICWPQPRTFPVAAQTPFASRKLLVNISMNKTSSHPRELYSARRDAIEYFTKNCPDGFDLYGIGWNGTAKRRFGNSNESRTTFSSYRGTLDRKADALPKYRFSICYENIRDEPGWITEKIFDSMRAGCVPIYWGASNVTEYVDKECFIDRRNFNSDAEVHRRIASIDEAEFSSMQAAIKAYLSGPRFEKFLPPAFAERVASGLALQ